MVDSNAAEQNDGLEAFTDGDVFDRSESGPEISVDTSHEMYTVDFEEEEKRIRAKYADRLKQPGIFARLLDNPLSAKWAKRKVDFLEALDAMKNELDDLYNKNTVGELRSDVSTVASEMVSQVGDASHVAELSDAYTQGSGVQVSEEAQAEIAAIAIDNLEQAQRELESQLGSMDEAENDMLKVEANVVENTEDDVQELVVSEEGIHVDGWNQPILFKNLRGVLTDMDAQEYAEIFLRILEQERDSRGGAVGEDRRSAVMRKARDTYMKSRGGPTKSLEKSLSHGTLLDEMGNDGGGAGAIEENKSMSVDKVGDGDNEEKNEEKVDDKVEEGVAESVEVVTRQETPAERMERLEKSWKEVIYATGKLLGHPIKGPRFPKRKVRIRGELVLEHNASESDLEQMNVVNYDQVASWFAETGDSEGQRLLDAQHEAVMSYHDQLIDAMANRFRTISETRSAPPVTDPEGGAVVGTAEVLNPISVEPISDVALPEPRIDDISTEATMDKEVLDEEDGQAIEGDVDDTAAEEHEVEETEMREEIPEHLGFYVDGWDKPVMRQNIQAEVTDKDWIQYKGVFDQIFKEEQKRMSGSVPESSRSKILRKTRNLYLKMRGGVFGSQEISLAGMEEEAGENLGDEEIEVVQSQPDIAPVPFVNSGEENNEASIEKSVGDEPGVDAGLISGETESPYKGDESIESTRQLIADTKIFEDTAELTNEEVENKSALTIPGTSISTNEFYLGFTGGSDKERFIASKILLNEWTQRMYEKSKNGHSEELTDAEVANLFKVVRKRYERAQNEFQNIKHEDVIGESEKSDNQESQDSSVRPLDLSFADDVSEREDDVLDKAA